MKEVITFTSRNIQAFPDYPYFFKFFILLLRIKKNNKARCHLTSMLSFLGRALNKRLIKCVCLHRYLLLSTEELVENQSKAVVLFLSNWAVYMISQKQNVEWCTMTLFVLHLQWRRSLQVQSMSTATVVAESMYLLNFESFIRGWVSSFQHLFCLAFDLNPWM